MTEGITVPGVRVTGKLLLDEFSVTADDLNAQGVFTISPGHEGVTLIADPGILIKGICVFDTDGVTDITASMGGMTIFLAVDAEPFPQFCTAVHESADVLAPELRLECASASGGPRVDAFIGRAQTSIRYSSALQRWVVPNWAA